MDGSLYRWINWLANRTHWANGFFTAYANYGVVLFALLLLAAYLQGRQHGELHVVACSVWAPVMDVILSSPRPSVADPQITPLTQSS